MLQVRSSQASAKLAEESAASREEMHKQEVCSLVIAIVIVGIIVIVIVVKARDVLPHPPHQSVQVASLRLRLEQSDTRHEDLAESVRSNHPTLIGLISQ